MEKHDTQSARLIRAPEAARILGLNHRTLLRWRQAGVGPEPIIIKAPGRRGSAYYRIEELLSFGHKGGLSNV